MENDEEELVEEDEATRHQPMSSGFVAVLYCKAAFNLLASIACFFFITAMLSKSAIRKNAYNLYVIFMILPDGINTFFRVLTNLFIAANHGVRWFPPGYYYIDLFFWMFYYMANFYTNTIVTYEIDKLVRNSHQGKRVTPLTIRKVLKQVSAVYLFAIFMSLLMVLPVPFALFHITDERRGEGAGGSPQPGGWFNFWAAAAICLSLVAVPAIYVLFVRIRIWKRKLLPERGRTRVLSLFFLRVVIIFVIFYVPGVLLSSFRQRMNDDSAAAFWVDTILGILSACQALTTLYMIWLKDDIQKVVNHAWNKTFGRICYCCRCCDQRHPAADLSGSVYISGHLSRPPPPAKMRTSSVGDLSQTGRSGDSSHLLVEQVKGAWSEDDEYPYLPEGPGTSEEAPSVDAEQPKSSENDQ